MNTEAVTDALVRHMADETTCSFFDDRLACDTALYYPNGDSVVVYVTDHAGLFEVSDYSEGMALAMQRLHRRSGVLATVGQRAPLRALPSPMAGSRLWCHRPTSLTR